MPSNSASNLTYSRCNLQQSLTSYSHHLTDSSPIYPGQKKYSSKLQCRQLELYTLPPTSSPFYAPFKTQVAFPLAPFQQANHQSVVTLGLYLDRFVCTYPPPWRERSLLRLPYVDANNETTNLHRIATNDSPIAA